MTKKKITNLQTAEKYSAFIDSVTLYTIGLDEISAKLNRDAYFEKHGEGSGGPVHRVTADVEVEDFSERHFDLAASLELVITHGEKSTLQIKLKLVGHFHAAEPIKRGNVERFSQSEAALIFWPYLRQNVSDITSRMHIPPITLPMALKRS